MMKGVLRSLILVCWVAERLQAGKAVRRLQFYKLCEAACGLEGEHGCGDSGARAGPLGCVKGGLKRT